MGLFVAFVFIGLLFYAIAELFGRAKHIGRGWTFFLLAGGLIPGIIALIMSPSAKRDPTSGSIYHIVAGWISIIGLGVIPIIPSIISLSRGFHITGAFGISLSFIFLGFYLINLGKGRIVNRNPKFYFSNIFKSNIILNHESRINIVKNSSISFEKQKKLILELKNNKVLDDSEYESKLKQIEQEQAEDLLQRTINERIKPDLKKLTDLKNANILTDSEFNAKKEELISSVTYKIKTEATIKDEIQGTKQYAAYLINKYWHLRAFIKEIPPLQILICIIGLIFVGAMIVLDNDKRQRESNDKRQRESAIENEQQRQNDSISYVISERMRQHAIYDLNNVAYWLIKENKLEKATILLDSAIRICDDESCIWGSRGELYYKKNMYKECISDLTIALNLISGGKVGMANRDYRGHHYYYRGMSRLKLGQTKEGNEDIAKSKELNFKP